MLWHLGNNPSTDLKLGRCEGDCDSDSDCADGLMCYQRDGYDSVPGCAGGGSSGQDYCAIKGEGDCYSDNDCQEGLVCYHATGTSSYFPGCEGGSPKNNQDYCVDPADSKKLMFMPTGS